MRRGHDNEAVVGQHNDVKLMANTYMITGLASPTVCDEDGGVGLAGGCVII